MSPKALLKCFGLVIAMERRSHSVPLGNPFWSERTQDDYRVALARPSDLPKVPTDDELDDEAAEPIRDGASARVRERSRPRGRTGAPSDEKYGTPMMTSLRAPSSWIKTEPPRGTNNQPGRQTEGFLPPSATSFAAEEGMARRTEGPLPPSAANSGDCGLDASGNGLEVDLGRLMFEQLQEENAQLRSQLEAIQTKGGAVRVGVESMSDSWSYVPGSDAVLPPPPKTPRLHVGAGPNYTTSIEVRYTPGGTRVPDGPPPVEDGKVPSFPAWPPTLEAYAGCAWEQRTAKGSLGDGPTPAWMRAADRLAQSPRQARMAWLEREVSALRDTLKSEGQKSQWSSYWKQPAFHWASGGSPPFLENQSRTDSGGAHGHMRGSGDLPPDDRALQVGSQPDDRALQVGGQPGDRALQVGSQPGDRVLQVGGQQGDRVLHVGHRAGDRAEQMGVQFPGQRQGLSAGQDDGLDHLVGVSTTTAANPAGGEGQGAGSRVELPPLPEKLNPMELGDWLCLISPIMRDLNVNSAQ